MNFRAITFLLPLAWLTSASGQGIWIDSQPATNPPARAMCGLVSMDAQATCVLFGGEAIVGGAQFGDTWIWNGIDWTQAMPANSPGSLEGHAMCYDPLRDVVTLFAGWDDNQYRQETWEWDGTNWTNVTPAAGPQPVPRDWHGMAYDLSNSNSVLFGGHDFQVAPNGTLGDTWTWDGTTSTWTQQIGAGPSLRLGHSMLFDPNSGNVILFGGTPNTGAAPNELNDTWSWDGAAWTQLSPSTVPPARKWHRMAWDPIRSRHGRWRAGRLATHRRVGVGWHRLATERPSGWRAEWRVPRQLGVRHGVWPHYAVWW